MYTKYEVVHPMAVLDNYYYKYHLCELVKGLCKTITVHDCNPSLHSVP